MMPPDAILALLPLTENDDPQLWFVGGDAIVGSSALSQLAGEVDSEALREIPVTLIAPASHSTFRRVETQGLEPRQELAVAKITAQEQALGKVQAAAALDRNGKIRVATMDAGLLQNALDRFADKGMSVAAIIPFGAIFQPSEGDILRAELGNDAMLCSAELCCVDEPSLAAALFGDISPRTVSEPEMAEALVAISRTPEPNFLDGMIIRRKAKPIFSDANRKWVKRLSILATCLLLAGSLLYWAKLQWAIASENRVALAAAQSVDPAIEDIARAEAAVGAALARKGIDRAQSSMLVAILWQATKARENVAVTDLSLGENGLLSATLSAPETDGINAVLLSIQRAGYQITATPRRDASGGTLVDLTVKAP
jgi:general secretion pathway protein L